MGVFALVAVSGFILATVAWAILMFSTLLGIRLNPQVEKIVFAVIGWVGLLGFVALVGFVVFEHVDTLIWLLE